MAADRRIDSAGRIARARLQRGRIERLAHAVQTLQLEAVAALGQLQDRRQGLGIVGRELGIERLPALQQTAGADQIGDIGRQLAGEHRVAGQALLLGMLDLAVPVGALHETHRNPPALAARQGLEPGNHRNRAFLIGLNGDPDARPASQLGRHRERFEQIERGLQPIGFLGIDGDGDLVLAGQAQQLQRCRKKLGAHTAVLAQLVARMQRRQLDRDAGPGHQLLGRAGAADRLDGMPVGGAIAQRIGHGPRGFAQHVVGVPVAAGLGRCRPLDRLLDRLAKHEMAAEHAHRLEQRLAQQRLAQALHQPPGPGTPVDRLPVVEAHEPAGQHQAPG